MKKNRIGIWFSCNFSGFLAIGTYIVTYGAGEKSCCQWCRFSYLWCYCLWCNLVTKSKSSCQWCCNNQHGKVSDKSLSHVSDILLKLWRAKRICVFEHSVMTNFNCVCPAIQRDQGSGFLSEGSSWLTACMSEQRRFWRDCTDAQVRLNFRCSHRR